MESGATSQVDNVHDDNVLKGSAQPAHEILSGNSLNIFGGGQEGMDTLDMVKKDSYSYRSPLH